MHLIDETAPTRGRILCGVCRHLLFLASCLMCTATLHAQKAANDEDDDDEPKKEQVAQEPALNPEVFDQWLFPGRSDKSALQDLESQLAMRISEIDQLCKLTLPQLQKLQLAGRTDIKRIFDRIAAARRQFELERHNQRNAGQLHQMIQPLRIALISGLFGEGSLFEKVARTMLTPEQRPQYQSLTENRRKFRQRARIEMVVFQIEQATPLRGEQRKKLLTLLETLPSVTTGPYEMQAIWLVASQVPADKYREILDGPQFKVLQARFAQQQNMEQMLRNLGALADQEVEERAP